MAKIEDNRIEEVSEEITKALEKAFTIIGGMAMGYATAIVPVKTSRLKDSITFKVDNNSRGVTVGTKVEYAPYVEYGTGIFAEGESHAKKIPWAYKDEEDNWYITYGMKPHPYLRPAIENHLNEYEDVLKTELGEVE